MTDIEARKRENLSAYTAIAFYAATVALGIGGFVLLAYGRTLQGTLMGAGAFLSAALCMLAARASIRWRRLAEDLEAK